MRPEILRAGTALLAVALIPLGALRAADLTPQQQIESRLMCYCGCANLKVRTCTCGTADAIREEIAGRLTRGETPDQVVASFVARHGEQILSAPTKQGFNLVAWITPFALILMAGIILVFAVRRWEGKGLGFAPSAASAPGAPPDPSGAGGPPALSDRERDLMARVEREIREDT